MAPLHLILTCPSPAAAAMASTPNPNTLTSLYIQKEASLLSLLNQPLSLRLSAEQVGYCRQALHALSNKTFPVDGVRAIDAEFESLTLYKLPINELVPRTSIARLETNVLKNRYGDVLPFDDTRVVLKTLSNDTEVTSTYINASYILEHDDGKLPSFIATQGPLKNTIDNFWEMILQEQCSVIVMLTCLVDPHTKVVKCESYFPFGPEESETYGQIQVTTRIMKTLKSGIVLRLMEVKHMEEKSPSMPVLHLHFLDWPDLGVPASSRSVREIFRKLYQVPPSFGPLVTHCSAGVGRTGTYCTIDYTLRRILLGDISAVDIEQTVRRFRERRFGMVETKDQYLFCYQTVIDELQELLAQQDDAIISG